MKKFLALLSFVLLSLLLTGCKDKDRFGEMQHIIFNILKKEIARTPNQVNVDERDF